MLCVFIGHRDAPEELRPRLAEAVERHITQYGVTEFAVGSRGRFDDLAARAVRDAKKRHPRVTLLLLLFYLPDRADRIPEGFDGTVYPPGMETVPRRYAIARANRYLASRCDFLICWDTGQAGNTHGIARAARRCGARVTNLADLRPEGTGTAPLMRTTEGLRRFP